MAKISELADGGNLLNDDELIVLRAGGNVRATVANLPEVDASGNQSFADNEKAIFGTGSDLQIYHDGSNSYIKDSGTGNLNINASNLALSDADGNYYITGADGGTGGTVRIYHNNSQKLVTESTGINVTGTVTADDLTVDGAVVVNSDTTTAITATQNANTDSNGLMGIRINNSTGTTYAAFGNSGADSVAITAGDAGGTGNTSLSLRVANAGSESEILGIDSTGIDVTGTVTADGLTVDGTLGDWAINSEGAIQSFSRPSTSYIRATDVAGSLAFDTGGSNRRMFLANNGDISFYEDTGTTAKFFWDASAETVEIAGVGKLGATDGDLNIYSTASNHGGLRLGNGYVGPTNNAGTITDNAISLGLSSQRFTNLYLSDGVYSSGKAGSASVFNEDGTTADFRVESSGNTHMLFVDGGTNKVGIGTSSPATMLELAAADNDGTNAPRLRITNSSTTLADGARVGTLEFHNSDTTGSGPTTASIEAITNSSDERKVELTFNPGFNGSTTEAMRIDSSGNVGIGTSGPTAPTDIRGANSAVHGRGQLYLSNTETAAANAGSQISFGATYSGTTQSFVASVAGRKENGTAGNYAGYLQFSTRANGGNNTERMRIDSSGNVGIGTTSPAAPLHLSGSSATNTKLRSEHTGSSLQLDFVAATNSGIVGTATSHPLDFYTNNAERMRIDSSGNVGIGTASPTARLHLSYSPNGGPEGLKLNSATRTTTEDGLSAIEVVGNSNYETVFNVQMDGQVQISPRGSEAMRIDTGGNVGIGTTTPNYLLDVEGSGALARVNSTSGNSLLQINVTDTTSITGINFGDSGSSSAGAIYYRHTGDSLAFTTAGSEAMRIDSSGNVGIGITSPENKFHIRGTADNTYIRIDDGTDFSNIGVDATGSFYNTNTNHRFLTASGSTEAMRIDSSGNLLVGKTSGSLLANDGVELRSGGEIYATKDGGSALFLNRKTSDGTIVDLRKDNTTVGSIGSLNGKSYIAGPDVGVRFGSSALVPTDSTGNNNDTGVDIGDQFVRFKDLYLSGGAYLGGTAAANKLDDYEEGTWTVVISGETAGSVTTTTTGYYTKIGNTVHCAFYLNETLDLTSISGLVNINLPFLSTTWLGGGSVVYGDAFFTGTTETDTFIGVRPLGTECRLAKGSSTTWITDTDIEKASGAKAFMFDLTYQVA